MKKVGARILLCLMLVIALVTSTLTAFAEPNTTETPEGLDLSKFKTVDLKDVGGVYNNEFYIKKGYSYLILYKDSNNVYHTGEVEFDSEDLMSYVTNKDNYNTYNGDQFHEGYFLANSIDNLNLIFKKNKCWLFLSNGNDFMISDLFSVSDLSKLFKLDLEPKLPTLTVSITDMSDISATIHVKFSSVSGVGSIVCRDSTGFLVDSFSPPSGKNTSGSYDFKVTENGKYTIEGYNYTYASSDEKHSYQEVDISNIVVVPPVEVKGENNDSKKPVITFSDKPKSALDGSTVQLTMISNEPTVLNFNGESSEKYVNKMKISISSNGKYSYTACDKNGNITKGTLKVNFFKKPRAFEDEDRDNFWNNPNSPISTITSKLPQTGSVGWYWMIAFGVALVGVGGFVVFKATKSRKNKGIENK